MRSRRRRNHRKRKAILAAQAMTRWVITSTPDVTIAAAAGDDHAPRFEGVAYTGGPIEQPWSSNPIVIDLAGLEIPRPGLPVRLNHNPNAGVGHLTKIKVENNQLVVAGVISRATREAGEVVLAAKQGFPWGLSIGARVKDVESVGNAEVRVNGKVFRGPLEVVRRSVLMEVSFVDLGADLNAYAKVAAQFGGLDMSDEPIQKPDDAGGDSKSVQAAVDQQHVPVADVMQAVRTAEQLRIQQLTQIAAGYPSILQRAIREGWTVQQTELAVQRAARPVAGPYVHANPVMPTTTDILAAAVMLSAKVPEEQVARDYTPEAVDYARRRWKTPIGLHELLVEAAVANGMDVRCSRDLRTVLQYAFMPTIYAGGFSTIDVPGILSATANKFLVEGFNSVEDTWRFVAARRAVRDFKAHVGYRLTGNDQYQKVPATGEIKHGTLGEKSYSIKADTYGLMYTISREDLVNDDLSVLTNIPRKLGVGAGRTLNKIFWDTFVNNGSFFTSGNGNFLSGANTALGIDSLATAATTFAGFKDEDGNPIGLRPSILLVPKALEPLALQLTESMELRDNASSSRYPVMNPHRGKYRAYSSLYLDDNSTKAWYLLASPDDAAVIEVAFLNGNEAPTIETADADFSRLGIAMRGYHDFGVALMEPKGGIKMKGEA